MNKKGNIPVPIVILVLLTLVLCITAVVSFANKKNNVEEQMVSAKILDSVYAKEDLFMLYLEKGVSINETLQAVGGRVEGDYGVLEQEFVDSGNRNNNVKVIYRFKIK